MLFSVDCVTQLIVDKYLGKRRFVLKANTNKKAHPGLGKFVLIIFL